MSRKIFVSYKYGDGSVRPLPYNYDTRARHYVDLLQARLDANDHINKGEDDGEDMSGFKDETIASNLRDKIYDSSITLVLISKNMKNNYTPEEDQWMPWEISYSLKEKTREDRTSSTNAVLAVVIPDENGSYAYFFQPSNCPYCNTITWRTDLIFKILGQNMFNRTQPKRTRCASVGCGREPHMGNDHSYIHSVKWDDFISNINSYISIATEINDNIDDYNLVKEV